ncbi:MAG: tetratricopeptide repeat protein [Fuerstiella sp.]
MVGQSKAIFTATLILCVSLFESDANAFQVFSNSRAGASAKPQNTRSATGTISRGNRHGLAGGLSNHQWSYNSPGGQFRSNTSRRSTSSYGSRNHGTVFHNYNSGTLQRSGTSTYYGNPVRIQRHSGVATFSGPSYYNPNVPGFNGVAVGGVIVNGGFGNSGRYRHGNHQAGPVFLINPYGGSSYSPYGTNYPGVPGGQVPFGVYAPPIVVSPLNQGPNLNLGVNVVPNNVVPNSIAPNSGFIEQAPFPNQLPQPEFNQPGFPQAAENFRSPISIDEAPIANEFPLSAAPTDTVVSSTSSRIQSLRYQASADVAYRESDFASAEALYRTATKEAPERQAPWLRLAFTQIQLGNNADAVISLKSALNRNDDPTAAWVSSKMLSGTSSADRSSLSEEGLFEWLKQRPNSSDRLLLTAAWSQFRGSSSAARELIQLAKNAGLSNNVARNLNAVITDSHAQEIPGRNDQEPNMPEPRESKVDSFSDADILLLPQATEKPVIPPEVEETQSSDARFLEAPQPIGGQLIPDQSF